MEKDELNRYNPIDPSYKINMFIDLLSVDNLKNLKIFSFSASPMLLKNIAENKKDTDIEVYVGSKNTDLIDLDYQYDNLKIEIIPNLHFKTVFYDVESKVIKFKGAFFGSLNLTSKALLYNDEIIFNFPFTEEKSKDKKYSSRSLLQGLCDKIYEEAGVKLFNEKISKCPVEYLDAKEYYKEIKKISNKISSDSEVIFVSQKISEDIMFDLFGDVKNLKLLSSKDIENLHSKMFYIESEDKYYVGFGSSNFTYSGLGLSDKYTKKEVNLVISEDKEIVQNVNNFLEDPVNYVYKRYLPKTRYKDIRLFKKYEREVCNIERLFNEINGIWDKLDKEEISREIGLNLISRKLESIFDIVEKPKEDVINKSDKIMTIKDKVQSFFKT